MVTINGSMQLKLLMLANVDPGNHNDVIITNLDLMSILYISIPL